MASSQSLIGLFGVALALAVGGAALAGRHRRWFAVFLFLSAWVPVAGVPLAGYIRGVTGDLSSTTIVLLVVALAGGAPVGERRSLSVAIVVLAVFLYPMALGAGGYDPYRLGFAPGALLAVLFVAAGLAWLRQLYVVLACLLVAVSGHALSLMESTNLWDYLLDPWLALVSIYDLRALRRKT